MNMQIERSVEETLHLRPHSRYLMADDLIYCRTQDEFIESVLSTVEQRDGYLLDELLNVSRMHRVTDLDFERENEINLDQALSTDPQLLWKQLSQHHWAVCRRLHLTDIDRAFRHQAKKFSCLISIFNGYQARMADAASAADENEEIDSTLEGFPDDGPSWLLPVFNRHAHELRLLALLGNDEGNTDDNDTSDSTNSNSTIQTCNSHFLQATIVLQRFPTTVKLRKVGIFIIVNQMLKTYYALHKFNLCTYSISKGKRSLRL